MKEWLNRFAERVLQTFPGRTLFVGIQGSQVRGEATADSDIDVVVVLDKLSYEDLKKYETAISSLESRDKICGFISGREELANWDRTDLFQFYYDTTAVYGSIDWIRGYIANYDIRRFVHMGACNIYHACVHNAVHEKNPDALREILKQASFVIKAKYYLENKEYIKKNADLIPLLTGEDKPVLELLAEEKWKEDFDGSSKMLMEWSGNIINLL